MEVLIKTVQEIIRAEGSDVFYEPYRFWAIAEDMTGGQYKSEMDLLCWLSNGDRLHGLGRVCGTSDEGQRQQMLRSVYRVFLEKGDKTAADNLMGALCAAFEWKPPAGVPTISRSAVSTVGRVASDIQRGGDIEIVSGRTSNGGRTSTGSGRTSTGNGKTSTGSGRTSTGGGRTSTSSGRTSTGGGRTSTSSGRTSTSSGRTSTSSGRTSTSSGRTSTGNGRTSTGGGQTSSGQRVQATTYRTTFYAENGAVLTSVDGILGSQVMVPVPPAVTGKRFLMWSPAVSGDSVTVNGNQEYRAIYTPKSPIIPILIAVIFCILMGGWLLLSNVRQSGTQGTAIGFTGQEPEPETEEGDDTAFVIADQTEISVGETTFVTFELGDQIIDNDENIKWESFSPTVAKVNTSGEVTGITGGTARISGRYQNSTAFVTITVIDDDSDDNIDSNTGSDSVEYTATGLGAVPLAGIDNLSDSIFCGEENVRRVVQGVEWNTDTMDTFYVCYASYIVSYDKDGYYRRQSNSVGDAYLFSIDYYDNKLFSVMRSSSYGKFKLRVYDADTLELINSTDLSDIHATYSSDNKRFDTKLIPSIDGIVVAPAIGSGSGTKIYVSYNAYYSAEDGLGLNDYQEIYEYDYNEALTNEDKLQSSRRFKVDLGGVKYGIQTLEYDRSTGNIWCAIRKGNSRYSLYCIDSDSSDKHLDLISNGGDEGWDCPEAGDGLCSLGYDWFYVLLPDYHDGSVSVEIRKVYLDDLENIG